MLQGLATPSAPTLTDSDPSTPAMDSAAIPSWQPVALVQASGQVPVQMWANQSRCRCGPVSAAGAHGGAAGSLQRSSSACTLSVGKAEQAAWADS
jgi:hypothetical protein